MVLFTQGYFYRGAFMFFTRQRQVQTAWNYESGDWKNKRIKWQ